MEAGNRRVSADELARLPEIYDVSVTWLLGETPDTINAQDPRLDLAARELSKLKPSDLERLLKLLAAMRSDSTANDPVEKMLLIRDRKDPRRKRGNNQRIPLLTVCGCDPCAP